MLNHSITHILILMIYFNISVWHEFTQDDFDCREQGHILFCVPNHYHITNPFYDRYDMTSSLGTFSSLRPNFYVTIKLST